MGLSAQTHLKKLREILMCCFQALWQVYSPKHATTTAGRKIHIFIYFQLTALWCPRVSVKYPTTKDSCHDLFTLVPSAKHLVSLIADLVTLAEFNSDWTYYIWQTYGMVAGTDMQASSTLNGVECAM